MSLRTTKAEFEQLGIIVYYGPVWPGDLIDKSARNSLEAKGLVAYLPGNNQKRARDGIRNGGWVATDAGRKLYMALSGAALGVDV